MRVAGHWKGNRMSMKFRKLLALAWVTVIFGLGATGARALPSLLDSGIQPTPSIADKVHARHCNTRLGWYRGGLRFHRHHWACRGIYIGPVYRSHRIRRGRVIRPGRVYRGRIGRPRATRRAGPSRRSGREGGRRNRR